VEMAAQSLRAEALATGLVGSTTRLTFHVKMATGVRAHQPSLAGRDRMAAEP
jgi:hypothetical protein